MCDFSLKAVKSQPANEQDKLVTHNFGFGTVGFKLASDENIGAATAVCVMPGTEIAFDAAPELRWSYEWQGVEIIRPASETATFRQINTENLGTHHDALEFSNGVVLLNSLKEGTPATVVRLPAPPKTEEEAKAQQRLEVVG